MANAKDITVTEGRAKKAVDSIVTELTMPKVTDKVKTAVEEERIRTGVITKFYPYLDKAEVKLDNTNTKLLCKILHRYGGDLIDFFTPLAEKEFFDNERKEPCVIPRHEQHVLVLKIHDVDSDENLILGYYQNEEIIEKDPAKSGNMKLISLGSATNQYWIQFGTDGLELRIPEKSSTQVGRLKKDMETIEHYTTEETYSKEEIDSKLSDCCANVSYKSLLNVTEDYKETHDNVYSMFRGDCWTINNNFESSAAITSGENTSQNEEYPPGHVDNFKVTGTFRTKQDMIGLYWNSEDLITHPYISYGKRTDYRNVILEFDYSMDGCKDFSYNVLNNHPVSLTISSGNGETYYFNMFNFVQENHVTINFDNLILTAGQQYLDANGNTVTIGNNQTKKVDVSNIKFIMIVLIPTNYDPNNSHPTEYHIMENVDFNCEITNITVTNGFICNEHVKLDPHPYRLCEGYDDFYNLNPKRVTSEMRKLGYVEWCDLYIGASHFYEKSGVVDDVIDTSEFNHTRTEKMVLNKNIPLNRAFCAWLDCYSKELKKNGTDKLVVSVSMENLQCPSSWRQKQYAPSEDETARRKNPNGYAMTGWIPSTFFYSPCHSEVLPYMQSVSEACLDIVVANDMQPILQLGEAWWWWNEYTDPTYRSPCFYDEATKTKYHDEFGKDLPVYITPDGEFNRQAIDWLNQQIVDYSWGIRSVVKKSKYKNGLYMALFFPPSVLDTDRVPPMMQRVNYLTGIYSTSQLDILQIEDYDWVTGVSPETKERDRSHHPEAYAIGKKLGFQTGKQHYFGGFVQYPKNATEYWRLIKTAMDDAISKGFAEVFVWAGSQVRRDHKMIGYDKYELVQNLLK